MTDKDAPGDIAQRLASSARIARIRSIPHTPEGLAEGATQADLLDAYPKLTREDVQACLEYAADTVAREVIVFSKAG